MSATQPDDRPRQPVPATAPSGPARRGKPTGARKWLYRLAAMTLIPVAVFALLEGSLRLFGYGIDTGFFLDGSDVEERAVWIDNKNFERWVFPSDMRGICVPVPFALPRSKAPGTYRVFVLGESAAMGFPDSSTSFARVLEVMLQTRFPDRRFEVVNTAMVAINSHIVRAIAQQCARQEPDLLVVHLGNNEVVGPFGAAGVLGPFSPHLQVIRANLAVKTTRSGQLLQRLRARLGKAKGEPRVWDGMATMAHSHVRIDDDRLTRINAHFRANLEDICQAATDAGAAVVVCTIPVNLKDSAPFGSLHRTDLTDEQTKAWDRAYQAGVRHEQRKEFADAVRRFEEAGRIDDQFADLAFRLGRCHAALGWMSEAKECFVRARDLDTLRFRTDTTINHTIREVIASRNDERIALADAEAAFERNSPGGIPGEDLFLEHVHMTFKGNYLLARTVFQSIPNLGVASGSTSLSEADCAERLARTEWNEWKHGTQIAERLLSGPPFTFQLDREEQCRRWRQKLAVKDARFKAGGTERAVDRYRKAIQAWPDDWMLRVNFALLLNEANRADEAGRQCRAALKQLRHCFAAHETLGNVELKRGNLLAAEEHFRAALRLLPEDVDAHVGLAWALEGQGKQTEALAIVEEQLRTHPRRVVVLVALGRFLFRSERLEEAKERFTQALELEPTNPALHADLAITAQHQGNVDEAIAHFEEALRLQPDWPALRSHLEQIRKRHGRGSVLAPR